jgi:hypothetical protein
VLSARNEAILIALLGTKHNKINQIKIRCEEMSISIDSTVSFREDKN